MKFVVIVAVALCLFVVADARITRLRQKTQAVLQTSGGPPGAKKDPKCDAGTQKFWAPGAGKGGIVAASCEQFTATAEVPIYRCYGGGAGNKGAWWSLKAPTGTKKDYLGANAVCGEWNTAEKCDACKLKTGSKLIVGKGEEYATCKQKYTKPASGLGEQVWLNMGAKGANYDKLVTGCTTSSPLK